MWKRFGPTQVKGETRSLNTGSMSQYLPLSLSRCDEWPRRTTWLASAASASSAWGVRARTGMGSTGTVSTLLPTMKRDQMRQVLAAGCSSGLGMFWNTPPLNCGEFS
ncbi:hypothetical protein D9M69_582520 [compost metagenome]